MKPLLMALLIFITIPALGQEWMVNTTIDSTQRDPQIERDSHGSWVVVWQSRNIASPHRGDIIMQRYFVDHTPNGPETPVNTVLAGEQEKPAAAMNAAGDLAVVWASMTSPDSAYDVKARLFPAGGSATPEILVNTTTAATQTNPDVAIDTAGNTVIVWDSWDQDGSDRGVFGRMLHADGSSTPEFAVSQTTAYSQAKPAVKFFPDGRFIVVWESWRQDGTSPAGYGVVARVFFADGTPASDEFVVNSFTKDYQWYADVETFDDGGAVIVWCSWEQDGSDGTIVFQRFSPTREKLGGEVIVNRTTADYQWLPRVRKFAGGGFVVVWSSWQQDGSREGVYLRTFSATGAPTSFETLVNEYTDSFQWEPDVVAVGDHQARVVWASWGQVGHDYDIMGKDILLKPVQGYLPAGDGAHLTGRSTSALILHVVDSLLLTGHAYILSFDSLAPRAVRGRIRDAATGDTVVQEFLIDRGENFFYRTPVFDGVVAELVPEFDLEVNAGASTFTNASGTNLVFSPGPPTAGTKRLAPIDVALIWGSTDTTANGTYLAPLDTALGTSGNVVVPFRGWNLTDNEEIGLLVVENTSTRNGRWTPGERIIFLTPPRYRTQSNNTHAEITSIVPAGSLVLPGPGDTNVVRTTRPLTKEDTYEFTLSRGAVVDVPGHGVRAPHALALDQNYPNPFNPATTIRYAIPQDAHVVLTVYSVLGERVEVLVDEQQKAGLHRVLFEGTGLASGAYFYRLETGGRAVVGRMMLLK